MPLLKRWVLTAWWAASVLLWALSATAGVGQSPSTAARQFEFLTPVWGAPWALPLAMIRAVGPQSGVPFNFEIALTLGFAVCLFLDLRRRRQPRMVVQAT